MLSVEGPVTLLQVFDMPRSVAFYRDILRFEVFQHSPERGPDDFDWGWLRLGTGELMLNTAYEHHDRPAMPDSVRTATHADTTLFFSSRDLDRAAARLREAGLAVDGPVTRDYGMQQVSLFDPDGHAICIQWPVEP